MACGNQNQFVGERTLSPPQPLVSVFLLPLKHVHVSIPTLLLVVACIVVQSCVLAFEQLTILILRQSASRCSRRNRSAPVLMYMYDLGGDWSLVKAWMKEQDG
jgi:hypothetical protein